MRNISRRSKTVILLSGGLDSATTLYFALKKRYEVSALIFNYGQRHKKELKCAINLAKLNKIEYRIIDVDISWANSSLTCKDIKVPLNKKLDSKKVPLTYVAGRNIIFLSYAVSYAESMGATCIFIGAHVQDYSGYPDCRPEFLKAMEKAINLGISGKRIKIGYPLINKSKKDIIKLGMSLGVPFEHTWSCYNGKKRPCEKCDSCRYRIKAFEELGLEDPALKSKLAQAINAD